MRRFATCTIFALAAAGLAPFAGCARHACPPSADDPDRCVHAGCPRFASGDARHGCTCEPGSVLLAAGCVSPATAGAYCGKGARFDVAAGACRLTECAPGQSLDLSTGACLPIRAVRAVAETEHVSLAKRETLGCRGDRPAVVEGGHAACIPDEALCPRGATWVATRPDPVKRDGRCERAPLCDAGEIADPESGMCLRVTTPGDGRSPRVDVARWARAALGADGGLGSPSFCAPLAVRPSLFALTAGGAARVRATIELYFPDADVTQLYAHVAAVDDATAQPLPPDVAAFVESSARPLFEALRAIGGEASAGAVKTTVRCLVRTMDHPIPVPRPGAQLAPPPDGGEPDEDDE